MRSSRAAPLAASKQGRPSRGTLVFVAAILAAAQTGCVPDQPPEGAPLGGIRSFEGDAVRLDFGAGELSTTGNDPWAGRASLLYPGSVELGAGPVELEVQGLDLSGISYRGDLGWPPDVSDEGAVVTVELIGSRTIQYRVYSSVAGLLDRVQETRGTVDPSDFRAYQFQGYDGDSGPYGTYALNLEEWGPVESRAERNTIDLRLRYEDGVVAAWVRLHASGEWEAGDADGGRACPWNVAMNNALPGTVDSVWTGECRGARAAATGRPVGAWVPVSGGEWTTAPIEGSARVGLVISNWQSADGPYEVSWQNVALRGPRQARGPSSSGGGRFRASGAGRSDIEPRGEWAEVTYDAVASADGRSAEAFLRLRSSGIDLTSEGTDWVLITSSEARFAGSARVNGEGGYRYELHGFSVDGEPDRVSVQVWGPVPSSQPFYEAFGTLNQGEIDVQSEDAAPAP